MIEKSNGARLLTLIKTLILEGIRYYCIKKCGMKWLSIPKPRGTSCHDDVIKWKHFPRNWPFVRGIHRSPVNSPHKGQWRGALMFILICVWINDWVNDREAGDLRRYRAHYDVIVMWYKMPNSRISVTAFSDDIILPEAVSIHHILQCCIKCDDVARNWLFYYTSFKEYILPVHGRVLRLVKLLQHHRISILFLKICRRGSKSCQYMGVYYKNR